MVDVAGIDKLVLLRALWENQATASFFLASSTPAPVFNTEEARAALARGTIDYLCGRAIKVSFKHGATIDPFLYDRVAGQGTLQRIVDQLRRDGSGGEDTRVTGEDRYYCESGGTQTFEPFGAAMVPGDPGTVLCSHCPRWKKQHEVRK